MEGEIEIEQCGSIIQSALDYGISNEEILVIAEKLKEDKKKENRFTELFKKADEEFNRTHKDEIEKLTSMDADLIKILNR